MLKAARVLRRIAADTQGAVAMMLALSLIPISIAALGAVDLERALSAKSQLQDALDAAALAALRASANDPTLLQTTGAAVLVQNLGPNPPFKVVSGPTFVYGPKGEVLADASARIDTILVGIFLRDDLTVPAHAEIVRSDVKLEIAMVLDNSGSMAQNNKIGDLRIAATNFVDTMETAATQRGDPTAVLMSLVPFSQTVRVDPGYRGAAWLDDKGKAKINDEIFSKNNTSRFALFDKLQTPWAGCLESRAYPYDVTDQAANKADSLFTPYFWPDEPDTGGYNNNYLPDLSNDPDWKARERNVGKYNVKNPPAFDSSGGPNKECVIQPLRPLTNDYSALRGDISRMVPTLDTNIAMGLVWGWHTISPNGPFARTGAVPVAPYGDPKHSKIAVVMTDGFNEFNGVGGTSNKNITRYEGVGYAWQGRLSMPDGTPLVAGSDADRDQAMDRRLSELCQNMKKAGVEVYAVAVGVAPSHEEPFRSCASAADHYYDVSNGAGLIDAFKSIAAQIANLHLAR
ncbi:MAG: hypothetical protein JWQ46_1349 [Phenylobacterium sp.]|nr:hypothetical protein [Phenylobacterium sp.]